MNTTLQLDEKLLERLLQDRLQANLPEAKNLKLGCAYKEGKLVILVQHAPNFIPDKKAVFSALQEAANAEQPSFITQVQMYLRLEGQLRPYASQAFTLAPKSSAPQAPPSPKIEEEAEPTFGWAKGWSEPAPAEEEQPPETPAASADEEELEASAAEDDDEFEPEEEPAAPNWKAWLPAIVGGTSLAGLCLLGSLYVLTAPCTTSACKELAAAQQLQKNAARTLQKPKTGQDILAAREQMQSAIRQLQSIPFWSSYHKDAQALLGNYQIQYNWLDTALKALSKGEVAAQKSQNPPHSPEHWQEIQKLWQEAAMQLGQIPQNSSVYPLAKDKIKLYKANANNASQRLTAEQQAKKQLAAAQSASKIADARQVVATSLENWQLADITWQTAINQLRLIPKGTTAYQEAQQLLALYQPKLAEARDRKVQEQFGANAYNQSLRIAQQAQTAGASSQWTQAAASWRSALTYIKQVPNNTFYYTKAQALANSYADALKQAEAKVKLAASLQQANSDLSQVCAGNPKICNYTVTDTQIKVYLTAAYTQKVKQTALIAKGSGDYKTQVGVVNHVYALGQALSTISNNSQMRLEVYGADGVLIETHEPGAKS